MAKKPSYRYKTAEEYVKILTEASEAYYNTGETFLSDEEFDSLRDEFEVRFPNHKYLKEVGAKSEQSTFQKVKHSIPMGSQSKVKDFDELKDWAEKTEGKLNKKISSYIVSEKVDGFSLSLDYEQELKLSVTRGDGEIGEDVTNNVKRMIGVPKEISLDKKTTIRGESVLTKSLFEKHFSDKKNPRNAAAGTVRRLDGEKNEYLTFLAYDIIIEGEKFNSEKDKFTLLKKLGFNTPLWKECNTLEEVHKVWEEYSSKIRNEQDYEMDGLVVTVNNIDDQNTLGIIDQRPRFSRAYKFTSQTGQSTVIDIHCFAGRTGRITPVAQIEPIFLGGVTIQNITLHNLSEVKKLGVSKGALVELKRAGDVIPKINKVIIPGKTPYVFPDKCPSCNGPTVEEDKFLMCYNPDCEAKHYENLLHWVKTLEIKGFGEELVNQLNQEGLLTSPADFYKLTVNDIASLDRRGEKSATKVLEELNKKKEISYPTFIKGLGIINFSDKTAELVQPLFPTIKNLFLASEEDLVKIHGVGEVVAKAIVKGLKNKKSVINELLKHITLLPYAPPVSSGKFKDKSFCFTGVRDKDLEKTIQSLGGTISSGVSKNLTYLIAKDPDENSSKLNKARELNIPILSLSEAKKLID